MSDPDAQTRDVVSVTTRSLLDLRALGESLGQVRTPIRSRESGDYRSAYRGRGVEFEESRPYRPGDDVRSIDWRVTARTGRTYTKLFNEERQRPVLFCVDFRAAMFFATRGAFKSLVAAKVAALLAWNSRYRGDRVGGLLFSEDNHRELRPQRELSALLALFRQLVEFGKWTEPSAPPTAALPLSLPLGRLRRVTRPGSLVFIISDFRLLDGGVERHLASLARHNTVVLIAIHDPIEAELPPPGRYRVTDLRGELSLDSSSAEARARYRARFAERRDELRGLCRRYGLSLIPVSTDADLQASLGADLLRRTIR